MGERFRNHRAAGLALQRVVADLAGGVERGLDIPLFQAPAAFLLRTPRPHSGEAIGLQLDLDAQGIGVGVAAVLAHGIHLGQDAQQVLHVVPDLVADHIGVGELARCIELPGHEVEEAHVQIHDPVIGTVERPGCRLPLAAGRGVAVGEQHQLGILVGAPELSEIVAPHHFGAAQRLRHEGLVRVVRRLALPLILRLGCRLLHGRALRGAHITAAEQPQDLQRVDAEQPAADQRNRDRSQSDAVHRAKLEATSPAGATHVLDVLALVLVAHVHCSISLRPQGQYALWDVTRKTAVQTSIFEKRQAPRTVSAAPTPTSTSASTDAPKCERAMSAARSPSTP